MQEKVVTGTRLSLQQKWLWLMQQQQQGQPFHTQCAYLIEGALDSLRLEKVLEQVVKRFDILRTAFHFLPGVSLPVQVVSANTTISWHRCDFSKFQPKRAEEAVTSLFNEMLRQPFDLQAPPLIHSVLARLNSDKHVLILAVSPLCADKGGLRNLVRELSDSYGGLGEQNETLDNPAPVQYASLSEIFSELLWSEEMAIGRDYWLKNDFTGLLDTRLPFAQEVKSAEFTPQLFNLQLRSTVVSGLERWTEESGLSIQSVLLACWQVLLWRLTSNPELVISVTYDGRNYEELVGALGRFERSLPHQTRLSAMQRFSALAAQVMAQSEEMGEWQEYFSWELIFKDRDTPLLCFGFEYEERATSFWNGDVRFLLTQQYSCHERCGIKLTCVRQPDGRLTTEWLYDAEQYQSTDVARLATQYATLLQGVVAQPDAFIQALDPVGTHERRQLLFAFNRRNVYEPATDVRESDLIEVLEVQAERWPERTALVFENECLTYDELNARANKMAHYLRRLGVEPDTLVGICMERSFDMVISQLAVLKAGGGYLPLDPDYPSNRLAFMLEDSGASLLLTHSELLDRCGAQNVSIFCVDSRREAIDQEDPEKPHVQTNDEQLAYVLYTSGSTGQPKGSMISRGALSNHMAWMCRDYPLDETDAVLQKTAFSFDASVWEFYAPLMQGARLVLAAPGGQRDIVYLWELIDDEQVTVLQVVPTVLQLMLDTAEFTYWACLRRVYCGGEALTPAVVERFRRTIASADLINLYGPTETCIDASHWLCPAPGDVQRTLIGRPIDHLQMYVLDERHRPTPIWTTGELYIGGAGVARGYLRRPNLTAERFVPDGFSGVTGSRLYKTGDLARFMPDGNIEYLGRADHQVKIRGQRVELAEVESRLTEHPRVRQAVTVADSAKEGSKRLVTYVVVDGEEELSNGELRDWVRERLPDYMVPSLFVRLAVLPLTPNGKVDRRKLPDPEQPASDKPREVAGPRTPSEKSLVQIWQEVLGTGEIGIFDNFFELGGDSILAIQVIARANQAGLQLNPKLLFTHQTVAELATQAQTSSVVQADQGRVTGPVQLTPWMHWFFKQWQPEPHHWNQSVIAELRRAVNAIDLERAVVHVIDHHDALRLRFNETSEGWQAYSAAAETHRVFSYFDLSDLAPATDEQIAAIERIAAELQRSLDLSSGPIVRVALFDLGVGEASRLLVIVHHLAVDGVSWRILLDDLQRAYEQQEKGDEIDLAAKTTSYQQWAEGLNDYAVSGQLNGEVEYWLRAVPAQIESLPIDDPEGGNSESSRQSVIVNLSAAETTALLQEVPAVYSTQINDVLLTALLEAYSEWTGNSSLLLALEGHGREEVLENIDLTRTVGWFTSFAPVLLQREEVVASPGELLKSVKERLRGIPNHGIGFGILRYLKENEALRALAEPQVSFNYLGQVDQAFTESSLFAVARESIGPTRNPQARRFFLLEIDSIIAQGQLQISFTHSRDNYRAGTIEELATCFIDALRALISHCLASKAGRHTPSDFPLARLTQTQLDQLLETEDSENIEDIFPLTSLQQGMLYHSLYAPESGVYMGQLAFTLHTDLNLPAFERAWQRVVDVNPTLRTTFRWEGLSEPLQIVHRRARLPMLIDDWRELTGDDQLSRLEAYLAADLRRGFDLSQPPLMRVVLMRVDENRYFVVWTQHHLLLDGWSLPLVRRETYTYYEAFCEDRDVQPASRRPFRSYIEWWQRQDLTKAERFWRDTLRGFTAPTLNLNDPKSDGDPVYAEKLMLLSTATTESLQRFARQNQITLSTIVQGAWALLLSHYCTTDDVVFGIVVSGRPAELAGVESMLGLLTNTLPLRVRLNYSDTLLPWLKRLQEQRVEMSQYEFSPLLQVQEWSEVRRGTALFQSILVFENFPTDDAVWQRNRDLQVVNKSTAQWTHYPLALIAFPGTELTLQISYDCRWFDRATIEQMMQSLEISLSRMVNLPEACLRDVTEPLTGGKEIEKSLMFDSQNTYEKDQFVF